MRSQELIVIYSTISTIILISGEYIQTTQYAINQSRLYPPRAPAGRVGHSMEERDCMIVDQGLTAT